MQNELHVRFPTLMYEACKQALHFGKSREVMREQKAKGDKSKKRKVPADCNCLF